MRFLPKSLIRENIIKVHDLNPDNRNARLFTLGDNFYRALSEVAMRITAAIDLKVWYDDPS